MRSHFFATFACLFISLNCVAQDRPATAPLEHDRHTHKHNPDHKTVPAEGDRFHTNDLAGKRVLLKFFRGGW